MTETVLDYEGNVIKRSKNLRGLREYASKNLPSAIAIDLVGPGEGKLSVLFQNRSTAEINFASFAVLINTVRHWHSLYGADLFVNGERLGEVHFHNPALMGGYR